MEHRYFSFVKRRLRKRVLQRRRREIRAIDWGKMLWWGIGGFAALFAVGVLGFSMMIWILGSDLPDVRDFRHFIASQSTIIYDREGNVLYTIHGDENREEIPLSQMPEHFINATLAIEDDQFYSHAGFDIGGFLKAVLYEATGIGRPRGGSTITQQLVKIVFLTPERSYVRKAKELILSMRVEQAFTKDEILEMYLNRIPYGSNAYGVQMASKTFFDKDARELTLLESAVLASLPQAPSRLSPHGPNKHLLMGYTDENGKYFPGRKDLVLDRMVETGAIARAERDVAQRETDQFVFRPYREQIRHPHFVFYVRDLLVKKFGEAAVQAGGLKVYTTIDPKLQEQAEKLISERRERYIKNYNATNAALFAVDVTNGQILSMVGSADYFDVERHGNVNVVFRPRSPGSSFKPVVYAAGFMKGYSPASVFMDVETDFGNDYKPKNYSGEVSGPVTIRRALAGSLNIPAVKMAYFAGIDGVIATAKKMGITSLSENPDQYGVSIGLGTGEVPLFEMVKAYSVLARGGSTIEFIPFLRIEDNKGNIIENFENLKIESRESLDPQIAYSVTSILSDASARPEGWDVLNLPGRPNGAKTGTSNKRLPNNTIRPADLWTLGYTTRVAAGVWIGNNNNEAMASAADGLNVAAPIWRAYMELATRNHPVESFPIPPGIEQVQVSKYSGKLPSAFTPEDALITDIFTTSNMPRDTDDVYAEVEVDGVSGKLPTAFTPASALAKKVILNFRSERPDDPRWEEPVQEWLRENFKDEMYAMGMPTEYDDVHTAETAKMQPNVTLVSPRNGSAVSFGRVGFVPQIASQRNINRVEYYVNDRLVDTVTQPPYRGSYTFRSQDLSFGKVSITAKAYDDLLYTATDTVQVSLGSKDTNPPYVAFEYPQPGSRIPGGSIMSVRMNAYDLESDVKEISVYLGSQKIAAMESLPFSATVAVPSLAGNYTLRATASDYFGNTAETGVTFEVIEYQPRQGTVIIVEPQARQIFASGKPVTIIGNLSQELAPEVARIEFTARKLEGGQLDVRHAIGSMDNTAGSRVFSFSWLPVVQGSYDISARAVLRNGESATSARVRVEIRE